MPLDEMVKIGTAIYLVFSHLIVLIIGMILYWVITWLQKKGN